MLCRCIWSESLWHAAAADQAAQGMRWGCHVAAMQGSDIPLAGLQWLLQPEAGSWVALQ